MAMDTPNQTTDQTPDWHPPMVVPPEPAWHPPMSNTAPTVGAPATEQPISPSPTPDMGSAAAQARTANPGTVTLPSPAQRIQEHTKGILRSLLDTMGEKIGGPSQVPGAGPNGETVDADGKPIMEPRTTSQRVLGGVGKMMVGMSAGMGAARGPGGFGRAMSASSAAVMELQEKNKAYAMQMHSQHMQDFTAYRHQMADQADAMDKNFNDHTIYRDALENSKTIVAGNGGQPMNWQDTHAWFNNMLNKKWGQGDLFQFAGPKEKNAPSKENPTGEGFHPTFFVYQSKTPIPATSDEKNAPHSDVTVDNSALADRLMVKEGSTVPAFMLAKAAGEDTMLTNGVAAIKSSLMGPLGLKDADFPSIPTGAQDKAKDAKAMTELMKEPSWRSGGDMAPAYAELKAKHPDMALTLDKYFVNPNNIQKASDIMRRASEKADEINKNPELAIASQEHRDAAAERFKLYKDIPDAILQTYIEELHDNNMTVKQMADLQQRGITEEFSAREARDRENATRDDLLIKQRQLDLQAQRPDAPLTNYWQEKVNSLPVDKQQALSPFNTEVKVALLKAVFDPGAASIDELFPGRLGSKGSVGGITRQQAMGVLSELDPRINEDTYKEATLARRDAGDSKGGLGGQVDKLNNFFGHAAEEQAEFNKWVKDHGSENTLFGEPFINRPLNELRGNLGAKQFNALQEAATIVNGEFLTLVGSGAVPPERLHGKQEAINDPLKATPAQIQELFGTMARMAETRATSINEDYRRKSFGNNFPNLIYPANVPKAQALGMNVNGFNSGGTLTNASTLEGTIQNTTGTTLGAAPPKPKAPGQFISVDAAKAYLKAAGGDKVKAQQAAKADQWAWGK